MVHSFRLFVTVLMMLPGLLHGQAKTFEVSAEPHVDGGELVVDLYIRRLGGTGFHLSSANFVLRLESAGLNLSAAAIDHSADGPWDYDTDSRGYRQPMIGQRDSLVVFNVISNAPFAKSMASVGGPGSGRALSPVRERLGRIRIPITDAGQSVRLYWNQQVAAVMDWTHHDRAADGDYRISQSVVDLCAPPPVPAIEMQGEAVACGSNLPRLRSSWAGTNRWYRNGVEIAGATGSELQVLETGSYTVSAVNHDCVVAGAQVVPVQVLAADAPLIAYSGDTLVAVTAGGGTLQWYRDGQPVSGATGPTYLPTADGNYTVRLQNACGSFQAAAVPYVLMARTVRGEGPDVQAVVAPNPYVEQATLTFYLPKPQTVRVDAVTLSGAVVGHLLQRDHPAGKHYVRFSARQMGLAPGAYLLRFQAGDFVQTFRLVEVR